MTACASGVIRLLDGPHRDAEIQPDPHASTDALA
jgi:hypothetical protein